MHAVRNLVTDRLLGVQLHHAKCWKKMVKWEQMPRLPWLAKQLTKPMRRRQSHGRYLRKLFAKPMGNVRLLK